MRTSEQSVFPTFEFPTSADNCRAFSKLGGAGALVHIKEPVQNRNLFMLIAPHAPYVDLPDASLGALPFKVPRSAWIVCAPAPYKDSNLRGLVEKEITVSMVYGVPMGFVWFAADPTPITKNWKCSLFDDDRLYVPVFGDAVEAVRDLKVGDQVGFKYALREFLDFPTEKFTWFGIR